MQTLRYKVFFSGRLAPGTSRDQVRANLIDMCSLSPGAADGFLAEPTVIRSGVDRKAAWRCWELFRRAGALCIVEPQDISPIETAGIDCATVICPFCRTVQARSANCMLCGLDLDRNHRKT